MSHDLPKWIDNYLTGVPRKRIKEFWKASEKFKKFLTRYSVKMENVIESERGRIPEDRAKDIYAECLIAYLFFKSPNVSDIDYEVTNPTDNRPTGKPKNVDLLVKWNTTCLEVEVWHYCKHDDEKCYRRIYQELDVFLNFEFGGTADLQVVWCPTACEASQQLERAKYLHENKANLASCVLEFRKKDCGRETSEWTALLDTRIKAILRRKTLDSDPNIQRGLTPVYFRESPAPHGISLQKINKQITERLPKFSGTRATMLFISAETDQVDRGEIRILSPFSTSAGQHDGLSAIAIRGGWKDTDDNDSSLVLLNPSALHFLDKEVEDFLRSTDIP